MNTEIGLAESVAVRHTHKGVELRWALRSENRHTQSVHLLKKESARAIGEGVVMSLWLTK
jgi:hypothetical protein